MRGVTVDPDRRIARCNGGTLLGELDDTAQAFGLACNVGTVSHTGVAGLTLGGGMGRLQRKLGLTIDCLRAVELVTADGRRVRASEDEHASLFWASAARAELRDRDGLEFDLEPIGPEITRGVLTYPADRARDVAAAFRDTMPSAPDDVMASIIVGRALPYDEYPAAIAGDPIVILSIAYFGSRRTPTGCWRHSSPSVRRRRASCGGSRGSSRSTPTTRRWRGGTVCTRRAGC
jgi:FAD/FMN-containing dehydrogenase